MLRVSRGLVYDFRELKATKGMKMSKRISI
jgi:hypothetical protein